MNYDLPTSVEIDGEEYAIRYDYRAILDIFEAVNDPDLNDDEKIICIVNIFYPDMPPIELWEKAVKECFRFINLNEDDDNNKQNFKLMDWAQDFKYIVAPINKVLGTEVRAINSLHWWTFMAAYLEIGDCLFAQIVSIRDKMAKGKPLEKWERKWYAEHRHMVDFKTKYSEAEKDILRQWGING